jgi:pimeloyl-ACP methyl ester carboxylesterase
VNILVQQQPAYAYTGGKPFDAAKPSVVFIHGAANDHSVWTYQARFVAHHGWNALALDLPGHGRSFGAVKSTIGAYADWLVATLDHAGIERATLIGHSMGSLIALDAAMRCAKRVERLMLIGCSVPMPVSEALLDAAHNRPDDAFDMLNLWGHAPQLRWGRNPTPGTSSLMAYRRLLEKSAPGLLATDLATCAAYAPAVGELRAITAKTTVLTGSRDAMTPAKAGSALAAQIPGAHFVALADAGHALMQEAPVRVIDELKHLLR